MVSTSSSIQPCLSYLSSVLLQPSDRRRALHSTPMPSAQPQPQPQHLLSKHTAYFDEERQQCVVRIKPEQSAGVGEKVRRSS